ncbi:methylaspartate mutase [Streptomyces tsukubensis]|uniref:Methylaspartate mutase n=1 Tax=Streptomyces tsukubensis TaxID=83656 RepID=A0A1V4AC59_9ACTN|nr:methylaspartate mutase [Streptomyces tsukubensis]OON81122.1 methylaspartate mutase [Streptomyces tsukubensis]QFR94957.1 methylaspartate mutase [Streptomyces tsukubensis]
MTGSETGVAPRAGSDVTPRGRFSRHVREAHAQGRLVVQPRMGFADLATMREGLIQAREADAATIGTVTLDSYTRVNDHDSARQALRTGAELNGFPLVAHGSSATRDMLDSVERSDFPVQVRHGSALPLPLFRAMVEADVAATEGGPISYCLPYSRAPISEAVKAWAACCELIAEQPDPMHLESFGGCMLGQLCPPSLLVALSVLETLFFREHGLSDVSLSYAQQTHPGQDLEAIAALRRLGAERLGGADWHVVLYTFMGVFPRTPVGSFRILEESVRLAVRSGSERLIVKTPAEAHRIPTIAENVDALEFAASIDRDERQRPPEVEATESGIYEEARMLIDSTLELAPTVGEALIKAFSQGHLDVPYCLHQDNSNKSRAYVDAGGMLQWAEAGLMPLRVERGGSRRPVTAKGLLTMLGFNEQRFDREQLTHGHLRSVQYTPPPRPAAQILS